MWRHRVTSTSSGTTRRRGRRPPTTMWRVTSISCCPTIPRAVEVRKMRWLLLFVLLGCTGCGGLKIGSAQTVLAVGSAASGIGDFHAKSCLWVIGSGGLYRGMAVLVAQGDATLEECRKAQPLEVTAPPLPPPSP